MPGVATEDKDGYRVRRLKDMVYLKEMRAALTSSEFALRLRGPSQPGLIDYEGLSDRLCTYLEKIQRQPLARDVLSDEEAEQVLSTMAKLRDRLDARIAEVASGFAVPQDSSAEKAAHAEGGTSVADATASEGKAGDASTSTAVELPDPRKLLYIREDQTVDFDGALTEANKAAKFSQELWQRLNGREEEAGEEKDKHTEPEGPRIVERQEALVLAQQLLSDMKAVRSKTQEKVLRRLRGEPPSGASAEAAPDPTADAAEAAERGEQTVEQAQAEQTAEQAEDALRLQLRECDQLVQELRIRALVSNIDLLLERAAAVVEEDLKRTTVADWDISGPELKSSVVMLSLLDKQASQYAALVPEDPQQGVVAPDVGYLLAAEELRILEGQVQEFALQLGLQVAEAERQEKLTSGLQRGLSQLERTQEKLTLGINFYVKGGQLLWQDVQYATALFSKAALQAYTLKPREVRTIQRTFKDLVTLVPFIIILIIPMTPVGHVLVFSFIQKFFPDFFPSTFTERRQNVVKIYSGIARPEAV